MSPVKILKFKNNLSLLFLKSKVYFSPDSISYEDVLHSHLDLKNREIILFYDKNCKQDNFISQFQYTIPLEGGESLKTINGLIEVLERISHFNIQAPVAFVAMGGGSVGDFVGFLASVYKRGVPLVHIPTTWVAAIDSAHGGKTALNVGAYKNQLGSVYPSLSVLISKNFLKTLSNDQLQEGMSELVKVAFLERGHLFKKIQKKELFDADYLFELVPLAVKIKMSLVQKDLKDEIGFRRLLNLGHTFAHALELNLNWSHGVSVTQGLFFSLSWSLEKGFISQKVFNDCYDILEFYLGSPLKEKVQKQLNSKQLKAAFLKDKKQAGNKKIYFIFFKDKSCFSETVSVEEMRYEVLRQKWTLS